MKDRSCLLTWGMALALIGGGGACTREDAPSGPTPATAALPAAAVAEARNTFKTVCAACHGPQGHGDGSAAAALPVKPRSFADRAWQDSVTDAQIEKVILEGGAAIGKSPIMPPNPMLRDKPEVLQALREIARGRTPVIE